MQKISYRDTSEEKRREQASAKAKSRKRLRSDPESSFGSPDKDEHFSTTKKSDFDDLCPLKKSKKHNKKDSQGRSTKWKYCMMLGCGSYRG